MRSPLGSLPALGLLYAHFIPVVLGQTTNATCSSNSTTSFLFNDAGESPCLAWAKLQSLCVPESAYINVPPLVDHTYGYNAPGEDGTACQCNVAAYNLMAACSWCQNGDSGAWASQWAYAQGCPNFTEDGLGFTQDVVGIPPYAWRQWDTARFDPALAAAAAPSFRTTTLAPQATTLSRSFTSIASSSASSSSASSRGEESPSDVPGATESDGANGDKDDGTPMGVMIGAIAGAIGGVILLAMLILFLVIRRRRRKNGEQLDSPPPPPAAIEKDKDKRNSRRFDPNYHSSTDWKNKHRSFLDMLTPTPKHDAFPPQGPKKGAPLSELFNDPKSFFSPRTAPLPAGLDSPRPRPTDSVESLRYTTTSERLKSRDRTESFSSGSELSFGIGPPKVTAYTKTKHAPTAPATAANNMTSVFSTSTMADPLTSEPPGQGQLLQAVKDMKHDDDPLETPPPKNFDGHSSYPFPRVPTPPFANVIGRPPASPPINTGKALPTAPSRISTKIPDPRFSSSAQTMITLPQPPITPAHDFTLPPEEYRRKQSRHYSGPAPEPTSVLPSLYEPNTSAPRFSISQRTDIGGAPSRPTTYAPDSMIFSPSAPSSASGTSSKYSSFIPDTQTINKVKAAFGVASPSPTKTLRFPLPPSRSLLEGSRDGVGKGQEQGKADARSQEDWQEEELDAGEGQREQSQTRRGGR